MFTIALAAYIVVALLLLGGLLGQFGEIQDSKTLAGFLAVIVFWPVAAVLTAVVLLWRIPFKSARQIRADFRNRRIAREFEEYLNTHVRKQDSILDKN